MVTNETEQGRQYKEYTREATGNKAERSAQLLGGEFLDERSSSTSEATSRLPQPVWKAANVLPVFFSIIISHSSCFSCNFFLNLQRYKTINQNVMNEKFPYGYDLNAYIDKGGYSVHVTAGNRSAGGSKTVFRIIII